MTERSLGELVERQLEVASLSGEVQSVMDGIVERLLELPDADGASLSTVEDGLAHFAVALGADAPLLGRTMPIEATLGVECAETGEVQVLRQATGADMARSLTEDTGAILLVPDRLRRRDSGRPRRSQQASRRVRRGRGRDGAIARAVGSDRIAQRKSRRTARGERAPVQRPARPGRRCHPRLRRRRQPPRCERCRRSAPPVLGRGAADDARCRPLRARGARRRSGAAGGVARTARVPLRAALPSQGRDAGRRRVLEPPPR